MVAALGGALWPEDVELGPGQQGEQRGQLVLSAVGPSGEDDPRSVFVPTLASWEGGGEEHACMERCTVADGDRHRRFSSLTEEE